MKVTKTEKEKIVFSHCKISFENFSKQFLVQCKGSFYINFRQDTLEQAVDSAYLSLVNLGAINEQNIENLYSPKKDDIETEIF